MIYEKSLHIIWEVSSLRQCLHNNASYEYGDFSICFIKEVQHLHEVVFHRFISGS